MHSEKCNEAEDQLCPTKLKDLINRLLYGNHTRLRANNGRGQGATSPAPCEVFARQRDAGPQDAADLGGPKPMADVCHVPVQPDGYGEDGSWVNWPSHPPPLVEIRSPTQSE